MFPFIENFWIFHCLVNNFIDRECRIFEKGGRQ